MVFVYILLISILLALAFLILKTRQNKSEDLSNDFFNRFNEKFPEILNQANTNLINLANEKVGTDLSNKKNAIEDLVKRVLEELNKNQKKLEAAESQRIGNFEALKESLDNYKKITQELSATAEGLKKVLSNNQLRGAFGEKVAEDLLKMSGFVKGIDYEFNKEQSTTETRPDFCIFLPDGAKINVDAKFPYPNLVKMSETDSADAKKEYAKAFERDVKDKIHQVCTRDYIDPENKTVDFCILFIPNEMIFSYIYEKMPEVWEEAMQKKVVLAGPFSFTAILRMVRQAYDNFRYQKNVQSIIGHIHLFEKEFAKYNEEFEKIGGRIDSLSKQYNEVSSTRTSKLLRVIDKIKIEDASTQKELPE